MISGRIHDPQLIGHMKDVRRGLLKPDDPLPADTSPLTGFAKFKQIFNRIVRQIKIWLTELIVPATPTERMGNFFKKLRHI